ncbi:MAG: Gfo/Idh/MocA family oxidoreductase [Rhodopirellula sp.]|nr:Gfo/Idh/MocA family oxidoreductase [Rhodopirellula sp.]
MGNQFNRREFIRLGTAAGLAGGLGGAVLAAEGRSKPIRLGVVGVGGRGTYLLGLALAAGVEVPALCDIREPNLNRAIEVVAKARGGKKPEGYSRGPLDYQRMVEREDLDAILIGTGMQIHAPIAVAAMRAGKHVLSEVAAAMTLDDCWQLVDATEQTGKIYMMAENCCYWEHLLAVEQMIRQGLFGELTYAECGYVHDCRSLMLEPDGSLTWRGEMVRDSAGDNYPTHNLGPVARWLGINRGDRFVSVVSRANGQKSWQDYLAQKLPADHPTRKIEYRGSDSVSTLIRTAKGVVIDVRYDIISPRPAWGPYHALQGTRGSFESRMEKVVWLAERSKQPKWQPLSEYAAEFEPPKWKQFRQQAATSGHGGADFFVMHEFLEAVRSGGPSPVDVYDAVAWSSIIALSAKSVAEGGKEQESPDFTRGKWQA